nr:MAG TPA: hypothetical protein [Caudoviricetes sp.]
MARTCDVGSPMTLSRRRFAPGPPVLTSPTIGRSDRSSSFDSAEGSYRSPS